MSREDKLQLAGDIFDRLSPEAQKQIVYVLKRRKDKRVPMQKR